MDVLTETHNESNLQDVQIYSNKERASDTKTTQRDQANVLFNVELQSDPNLTCPTMWLYKLDLTMFPEIRGSIKSIYMTRSSD